MIQVPRDDRSVIGQWWWTVDRWSLGAVLAIMAFGVLLTLAASPPAAERIGADSFLFAKRQFVFLPIALLLMLAISLASPRHVRRLALIVFCGSLLLLANVTHARQVHVFFRSRMLTPEFGATHESLEVQLVDASEIPWNELAFPSTEYALRRFVEDRAAGVERYHVAEMPRRF